MNTPAPPGRDHRGPVMKRAEISFKYGAWIVTPFGTWDYKQSSVRIRDRKPHGGVAHSFRTHEAALAHALAAVGLANKEMNR